MAAIAKIMVLIPLSSVTPDKPLTRNQVISHIALPLIGSVGAAVAAVSGTVGTAMALPVAAVLATWALATLITQKTPVKTFGGLVGRMVANYLLAKKVLAGLTPEQCGAVVEAVRSMNPGRTREILTTAVQFHTSAHQRAEWLKQLTYVVGRNATAMLPNRMNSGVIDVARYAMLLNSCLGKVGNTELGQALPKMSSDDDRLKLLEACERWQDTEINQRCALLGKLESRGTTWDQIKPFLENGESVAYVLQLTEHVKSVTVENMTAITKVPVNERQQLAERFKQVAHDGKTIVAAVDVVRGMDEEKFKAVTELLTRVKPKDRASALTALAAVTTQDIRDLSEELKGNNIFWTGLITAYGQMKQENKLDYLQKACKLFGHIDGSHGNVLTAVAQLDLSVDLQPIIDFVSGNNQHHKAARVVALLHVPQALWAPVMQRVQGVKHQDQSRLIMLYTLLPQADWDKVGKGGMEWMSTYLQLNGENVRGFLEILEKIPEAERAQRLVFLSGVTMFFPGKLIDALKTIAVETRAGFEDEKLEFVKKVLRNVYQSEGLLSLLVKLTMEEVNLFKLFGMNMNWRGLLEAYLKLNESTRLESLKRATPLLQIGEKKCFSVHGELLEAVAKLPEGTDLTPVTEYLKEIITQEGEVALALLGCPVDKWGKMIGHAKQSFFKADTIRLMAFLPEGYNLDKEWFNQLFYASKTTQLEFAGLLKGIPEAERGKRLAALEKAPENEDAIMDNFRAIAAVTSEEWDKHYDAEGNKITS